MARSHDIPGIGEAAPNFSLIAHASDRAADFRAHLGVPEDDKRDAGALSK
jgi:hypothetical protein